MDNNINTITSLFVQVLQLCSTGLGDRNERMHRCLRQMAVKKRRASVMKMVPAAADDIMPYSRKLTCCRCTTTRVRSLVGPGPAAAHVSIDTEQRSLRRSVMRSGSHLGTSAGGLPDAAVVWKY